MSSCTGNRAAVILHVAYSKLLHRRATGPISIRTAPRDIDVNGRSEIPVLSPTQLAPSPGVAEWADTRNRKHVFVTGAGRVQSVRTVQSKDRSSEPRHGREPEIGAGYHLSTGRVFVEIPAPHGARRIVALAICAWLTGQGSEQTAVSELPRNWHAAAMLGVTEARQIGPWL